MRWSNIKGWLDNDVLRQIRGRVIDLSTGSTTSEGPLGIEFGGPNDFFGTKEEISRGIMRKIINPSHNDERLSSKIGTAMHEAFKQF